MLTIAKEYIHQKVNPKLDIHMYGQGINDQTYAIAKSDFLIMGEDANNIRLGTSFSKDRFRGKAFNFMLSNPPFGVSWKKEETFIKNESSDPMGRFSHGLPRTSDGALLFLLHMISKMESTGSRIAIIFNGSPLFTGDAGSGESNIRKWIIENDWLETIVALPTDLFYNTGIATYIWIVTNQKPEHRKGKIHMINGVQHFEKMRKSLGSKRNYISDEQINELVKVYTDYKDNKISKIYNNQMFGYTKVTVDRPLTKDNQVVKDTKGKIKADSSLRDYEKIPLGQDIQKYFEKEVKPHVPDAWMDQSKDKIGYEINFTKYFYEYKPLRNLKDIQEDLMKVEKETEGLLNDILEE